MEDLTRVVKVVVVVTLCTVVGVATYAIASTIGSIPVIGVPILVVIAASMWILQNTNLFKGE